MRYRSVKPISIPSEGDAEQLILNLKADYPRFLALQDQLLLGRPQNGRIERIKKALAAQAERFPFSRAAHFFAMALLAVCVGLVLLTAFQALPKAPPRHVLSITEPAPVCALPQAMGAHAFLNRATKEELMQISGIGDALAERILLRRKENGPFFFFEDVLSVQGIGEKKLEAIIAYASSVD